MVLNRLKQRYKYFFTLFPLFLICLFNLIISNCNHKIDVTTEHVSRGKISKNIEVIGEVIPKEKYYQFSLRAGLIDKVHKTYGQHVEKGDTVLHIVSSSHDEQFLLLQRKILELELEIKVTKEKLEEAEKLLILKVITQKQVNEFNDKLELLLKLHEQYSLELQSIKGSSDTNYIIALYSGVLFLNTNVQPGSFVNKEQSLFYIAIDSLHQVESYISEDYLKYLHESLSVEIIIDDGHEDESISGKITFIASEIHGGRCCVLISLDKKIHCRIGTSVMLRIPLIQKENVLRVPIESIFFVENRSFIYLLNKDRVRKVAIEMGDNDRQHIEVLNQQEIQEGMQVITTDISQLCDGDHVKKLVK